MHDFIINNRYFNPTIQQFMNKHINQLNGHSICDVDSIRQCKNVKNVDYINQITDYNVFGDKFRHYDLLLKKLKYRPKFILETFLFNKNNLHRLKNIIKTKKIRIIKL